MSGWDAYINALKTGPITGCAIYGQGQPPALWAASSPTFISADETKALGDALTSEAAFDAMSGTGFKIGGTKFMKLNSEVGAVIRGKAGEQAAAAAASKKAIVFAVGKASPQEVSAAAEKMAKDLAGKGF